VELDDDRRRLTAAGLEVDELEAQRQLSMEQLRLEEPPNRLPQRVAAAFDEALDRGMTALWSSHTPVPADSESFERAMSIERAWAQQFHDRPVVTLCPYVVGGLQADAALGRLTGLSTGHDGVLVPSEQGLELFRPA
jgi:hypothetical protein